MVGPGAEIAVFLGPGLLILDQLLGITRHMLCPTGSTAGRAEEPKAPEVPPRSFRPNSLSASSKLQIRETHRVRKGTVDILYVGRLRDQTRFHSGSCFAELHLVPSFVRFLSNELSQAPPAEIQ